MAKLDFNFSGSCKIIGLVGYFQGTVRVAGVDKQLSKSRMQLPSHFSVFEVSSQGEAECTSELSLGKCTGLVAGTVLKLLSYSFHLCRHNLYNVIIIILSYLEVSEVHV